MRQKTENERSVVIQDTTICNYGEVRYKTANALNNTPGYDLTSEFMNAVRPLPSAYSEAHYMQFLDDWGTVSKLIIIGCSKVKYILNGSKSELRLLSNMLSPKQKS